MTAVTLAPDLSPGCVAWGWEICGVTTVVLLFSCGFSSNGFVGWEPHSGRKQSCYLCTLPQGVNVF